MNKPLVFGDKKQIEELKRQSDNAPWCPKCKTLSVEWWDCGDITFECPNCQCSWWENNGKVEIL